VSAHTHAHPHADADADADAIVATVGGVPVAVGEVDAREAALRATALSDALPAAGTSEGRQLRRWLTQLLVTERVIAMEAAARNLSPSAVPSDAAARGPGSATIPSEKELLPDATARLEIGSVAAATLADPLARALFAHVTAEVEVSDDEVAGYHVRNPHRFAPRERDRDGWLAPAGEPPPLDEVRSVVADHLRGAARRRAFRVWLDARRAALVGLAPGYEHPGDPRQPDNTHKH